MSIVNTRRIHRDRIIRLGRESLWLGIGQVLGILGSLTLIRETTQYLDPEQYGQLALTLTVGVFVCQVSMSGVTPGIMRYYTIAVERGDVSNFKDASYRLMGYGVIGTIGLSCMVFLVTLIVDQKDWIVGFLLAIVFTQINSFNSTLSSIQNAVRQRIVVVVHGLFDPWIKIGLLSLMVFLLGRSVISVIIAYILAATIILGSQLFFFRRLVRLTPDQGKAKTFPWLEDMVQYSKPFMIFNLFTWIQASSDRWALERFSGSQMVGHYVVLSQLGNTPVAMAVGFITNLIGPILQQRSGDATDPARNHNVWRISWQITFFGLALTSVGVLLTSYFHKRIFSLFVAEAYQNTSNLLPWFVLSGGVFAASHVLSLKMLSDLNTRALTIPKVVTSLFGLVLNTLGAWIWGIEGVVAASVFFSSLIFLWLAFLSRRPLGS